jgi:hypothetical protein
MKINASLNLNIFNLFLAGRTPTVLAFLQQRGIRYVRGDHKSLLKISVADPNPYFHFDANTDPTFHFVADLDPTFHFVADLDPTYHLDADPDPHQSDVICDHWPTGPLRLHFEPSMDPI